MKAETLQQRIERNLYTKKGQLAKIYRETIELLQHPDRVLHPVQWGNKGRSLSDHSANIERGLDLIDIDYCTGNDAPRGGRNGYYIRLTPKGKRQVKEYAMQYAKEYAMQLMRK